MIRQILRNVLMLFLFAASASADTTTQDEHPREGGLTGTGIVGEITALGSIIVNDQVVSIDPDLSVTNGIATKHADMLVPGDVVAVAVTPQDDQWAAEAISEIHPLIGPVSAVGGGRFTVLGVEVVPPAESPLPAVGDWIAVSGFWARDIVVATRIQKIAPRETVSIQGSYSLGPNGTTARIGPLDLVSEPLRHAEEGDVIRMQGRLNDGLLTVTDIHVGLFAEPVSLVLAEGYLTDVAPSGHYTVAGSGLSAYTDDLQSIMGEERITVCGLNGRLEQAEIRQDNGLFDRLGCPDPAN